MKKLLIGMAVFLLLGISSGVVLSYLSGEDEVINAFTAAKTTIEIVEEFDPPVNIEPGTEIRKVVQVKNLENSSCFVRMRYEFSSLEAEEMCEELKILDGWVLKNDGYYYWQEELMPGETTGPLFEKVVLKKDTEEMDLTPFELLVYAEAVAGGKDPEEAWAMQ